MILVSRNIRKAYMRIFARAKTYIVYTGYIALYDFSVIPNA